jgi:hypothetical protein
MPTAQNDDPSVILDGWHRAWDCPTGTSVSGTSVEAACGRAPHEDSRQPPDNLTTRQIFGRPEIFGRLV